MRVAVRKYGGSSLADKEKIRYVAETIKNSRNEGLKLVVVVSAMGKTTDNLVNLARQISENPDPRELDMLISTGEQISASLLAMCLNEMGVKSVSVNGYQLKIKTDGEYNVARIVTIDTEKLQTYLDVYDVVVVTGFQGVTEEGEITTLGRGGSDTSAVAIAAVLGVDCEIYSDVPGIFSVDPHIYPQARKWKTVGYDEMLEMSSLGSKVLHPRSVEIAKKYGIKIFCASTFSEEEGTYVMLESIESPVVTGLSIMENQAQVTLYGLPLDYSVRHKVFETASKKKWNVDMISLIQLENTLDISFSITDVKNGSNSADIEEMLLSEIFGGMGKTLGQVEGKKIGIRYRNGFVKVSVVGLGMKNETGVAARFFRGLGENEIPVEMVTTSEIKISILLKKEFLKQTVECLAKEFEL
jgi:aspartate kinase